MERTVILRFYEDITDRLENSRDILTEIICANYDAMFNDSYYCIERRYSTEVAQKDDEGRYICYNNRATMEWDDFLDMLWDMHDLHEYDRVFVWVSW